MGIAHGRARDFPSRLPICHILHFKSYTERKERFHYRAVHSCYCLVVPPTRPHFGGVQGTTILQAHGEGPFVINLVESASR